MAWPQRRLTYANAALAEVVITAGWVLGDDRLLANGLRMLAWLCDVQCEAGHLSVDPRRRLAARRTAEPVRSAAD